MIISYLRHLPAFSVCSVSSAALSAGLAAESLRCNNLLEDPGTYISDQPVFLNLVEKIMFNIVSCDIQVI